MIQWIEVPIYMHRTPVDFRKSINGLLMIVESDMALSPFSESLFVFGNASRDKIKILYWDKTGFCLWYKRLEKDKFKWPRTGDAILSLSAEQFSWLLRGLDIAKLNPHQEKYFSVIG
jgi:transposase